MITQYSDYGSISTTIQNIVANKVGLLDDYILIQTGENDYTALIRDNATKDITQVKIIRSGTTYGGTYQVSVSEASEFRYSVSNEYYVFSNQQIGCALNCPIYEQVTSYGVCIMVCVLAFAVLFKGVLFKCLKKSR